MPELDTYKGIERYARHPDDPAARLGFEWLRYATENRIRWKAFTAMDTDHIQLGCNIAVGAFAELGKTSSSSNELTLETLYNMPAAERDATYIALCKRAGIDVDPEALINSRQQAATK